MSNPVSLINTARRGNRLINKTITCVNPDATDSELGKFLGAYNDLSEDKFVSATRVARSGIDVPATGGTVDDDNPKAPSNGDGGDNTDAVVIAAGIDVAFENMNTESVESEFIMIGAICAAFFINEATDEDSIAALNQECENYPFKVDVEGTLAITFSGNIPTGLKATAPYDEETETYRIVFVEDEEAFGEAPYSLSITFTATKNGESESLTYALIEAE